MSAVKGRVLQRSRRAVGHAAGSRVLSHTRTTVLTRTLYTQRDPDTCKLRAAGEING